MSQGVHRFVAPPKRTKLFERRCHRVPEIAGIENDVIGEDESKVGPTTVINHMSIEPDKFVNSPPV
jgi:hypothetical protein